MKTQIVGLDSGVHNENLPESTARMMEGGSYKKQRVVMIIPTIAPIHPKVYLSHCSLIFPPNQGAHRMVALGMEVGDAYSQAIEQVLASQLSDWEFILTVEADNIPPVDGLIKLIKSMETHPEYSCIGGLYWTKGEGGVPQIWGDVKDPLMNFRPQPPDPAGGLVECVGTGMGFNLWRLSMFKDEKLRKPWFKTIAGKDGVGTQDLYFWGDARKYGYRCAVDCSVKVGHYDEQQDIIW